MFARHPSRLLALACLSLAAAGPATTKPAEDERPVVDASTVKVEHATNPNLPTLFVVGDSTANSNMPLRGWGSEIGQFFDPAKINVVNRAIGGRSSRSYISEGRWDKVLAEVKPGDVVLIQFGHNDGGDYRDPKGKGRPSLRGDEEAPTTQALKPDGKTMEEIHTYGWYMRKYARDAKAKGATPIILSMVPHKDWQDGKIRRGERETYVKWAQADAQATGALFVDANEIIAEGFEREGREKVEAFFGDARTHATPAGAKYNAAAIALGLKSLPEPNPLAGTFSKAADALPESLKPVQ